MNGVWRNRYRAHIWRRFMRSGGERVPFDLVRHYRSRYARITGSTVVVYVPQVVR